MSTIKPKILFIVDVQNWAFDFRARTWKSLLSDIFDIDIVYLKDYEGKFFSSFKKLPYNGYVFFFYKAIASKVFSKESVPYHKTAICINSEKWRNDGSEYTFLKYLKGVKLLIACNNNTLNEFSKYTKNIVKVTQCVDDSIFYPITSLKNNRPIKIGWCGNTKSRPKNIEYLIDACDNIPEVSLDIKSNLNQSDLNFWYNTLDFVVCVSEYEGGPNLLLEAGACKVPVITTSCGISDELIKPNNTGLIVPLYRTDILIKTIKRLAIDSNLRSFLSANLYREIKSKWTYDKKLHEIQTALLKLIS